MPLPTMTQGPGHYVEDPSEELTKDTIGFTGPNLHRRIDPQQPPESSPCLSPNSYSLGIYGMDSYRTVTEYVHDENSTTSEIP